jgi:uncharacterized membrane protein YuzA (DUF378 family)
MNNLNKYAQPDQLERNSFLWSEVRLIIAAVALFIGGYPPLLRFNPISALQGPLSTLLTLAWLISGAASLYLLYRWNQAGMRVFGGMDTKDRVTFLVSIVSGINLGLVSLLDRNIGMSISSNYGVFVIVGFLYLFSAWHLYKRWDESGQKLF